MLLYHCRNRFLDSRPSINVEIHRLCVQFEKGWMNLCSVIVIIVMKSLVLASYISLNVQTYFSLLKIR